MHGRREMIILAAMGALFPELAFAADPIISATTIAARQNAPALDPDAVPTALLLGGHAGRRVVPHGHERRALSVALMLQVGFGLSPITSGSITFIGAAG